MAISQIDRSGAVLLEKNVTLTSASATIVGISVPANTIVLAAGFENFDAVADITTYTMDITDGTTVFANDLNFDAAAAGTVKAGVTPGFIAAADTIDVVTTISGTVGNITGRVWAVVVDASNRFAAPGVVDRDQLA